MSRVFIYMLLERLLIGDIAALRWLSGDLWPLFEFDCEVAGDAHKGGGGGIIALSARLKLSMLVYIVLLLPRRS